MTRAIALLSTFAAAAVFCSAQAQKPLQFELASVRMADAKPPRSPMPAAGDITGGPGTESPARMNFTWILMRRLLMTAFAVPLDQISGSDWVMGQDARFDIVASVPPGTKKEDTNAMLLELLKERFHFTYHVEKKEFDAYTLVVAKGGSKLKDAASANGETPTPPAPGTRMVAAAQDRDGFPQLPPGRQAAQGRSDRGVSKTSFRMSTPKTLLGMLQFALGGRTFDETGLTGQYDFTLEYSTVGLPGPMGAPLRGTIDTPTDPAPDLFTAVEKQLGLKLEKSKTLLDVIVVDHMDKQPTEN